MNIHIPTYEEVQAKVDRTDDLTPLEAFIRNHEPYGEFDEAEFRADLHSLIEYVLRKEDK